MTAIISVLSGGSVVHTQALAAMDGGTIKRIRAIPGGQYVLADTEGNAVVGLLAKRQGKSLLLGHESEEFERDALAIDEFYDSHASLFGLGADGRYQPYVVLADLEQVEATGAPEGIPALLQLGDASVAASTLALSEGASAEISRAIKTLNARPESAPVTSVDVRSADIASEPEVQEQQHQVAEVQSVDVASATPVINQSADAVTPESAIAASAEPVAVVEESRAETVPAQTAPIIESSNDDFAVVDVAPVVATASIPVPVIDSMHDDHGVVRGVIANGGVTDDVRPEFTGKAEAGVIVHLYNGKYLIGNTTANQDGEWSFVPIYPLANGRHVISVAYQYPNGDVSEYSAPYVVTVDKIIPRIPIINDMLDDEGRLTGQLGNGSVTDDNRPSIAGLAEPLSTLVIYDKGKEIDRVAVDADGKWSFVPTTPLADGLHILDFAAVDRAGNMSERSSTTEFLVDTRAELVSIFAAEDRAGEVTGNVMSGGVTDDTQPRLFGSATAGGIVTIYEGNIVLGTAIAGVDGKWEFTPTDALSEGVHSLTATVTTDAKGESDRSVSFDFTVDVTAPDSPTIEQVYDDKGTLQSALSNGQSTDDTTPTLSGSAEAGSTVRIYDGGKLLGSTVADPAGKWSYVPNPALLDGDHVFTVTAQDKAGGVSLSSDPFAIVVDTMPPAPPVIVSAIDDQGDRTGSLSSGDITDDSKPTISGTAEANATVVIRDHGLEIGRTVADADGSWTFEPFLPMGLGAHKLTAEAVDAAGNTSALSNRFDLTLGSPEPPAVPAITSVVDDVGSVTGAVSKNDVTDDPRPTINGTAQPGMTVSVFIDGALAGTAEVQANGEWSFTPGADLADGAHTITAKATNTQGNISLPTADYTKAALRWVRRLQAAMGRGVSRRQPR